MKLDDGLRVCGRVGVKPADEAELVDVLGRVGEELGYPRARLAVLLESNLEAVSVPPPGPGLPSLAWSCGLYSQVSICETAPCMNRKMTRLAFEAKCGSFGGERIAEGRRRSGRWTTSAVAIVLRPNNPAKAR